MNDIVLENIMGKEAAARMRAAGLNKLAAGVARSEGIPVSDRFDLRDAMTALGTRLYIKNAQYKNILDGLESMRSLKRG